MEVALSPLSQFSREAAISLENQTEIDWKIGKKLYETVLNRLMVVLLGHNTTLDHRITNVAAFNSI